MYAVRLNPGATELTERDWYDYREDKNVCGYCKCILGKCKVTELMSQMAQLVAEEQENNETIAELTNKVDTLQTEVDDIIGGIVEIGTCGENIHYILYENGKLLLHGTGETYDYEIGRSPFWENENIRSLVVSDGITKIGNSMFERCKSMALASFPTSLTEIGERAFFMYDQGGLTVLTLPATVTTIGEKAFACESLTSVTLPETLTSLGTYLFMNSHTLTSARVECEEIPGFCFVGTPLQNLTLSYNVKKIGSHMINYTPLHELVYEGSLADWATVTKGGNWDNNSGQGDPHGLDKVICLDGIASAARQAHSHHNLTTLNGITDSHVSRWEEVYTSAMNLNERVGVNEGVFERFKTEILYDMQGCRTSISDILTRLSAVETALSGVESALADIVEVTT